MNGVDVANQLRKNLSSHRPQIYRTWVPRWHYVWDTTINNAYLSWRHYHERDDHTEHRRFATALIDQMRNWEEPTPHHAQPPKYLYHSVTYPPKRGTCQYRDCATRTRQFGTLLVNGSQARPARVNTYCEACAVYLCTKRSCWTKHHAQIAIYK